MGQTLSRRLAGRLESGMQRYRQLMEDEALQAVKNRKKDDAVHGGFQRGEGPHQLWKDVEQQTFLEQRFGGQKEMEKDNEMPEDLIKFLNDVGPLERKVDKDLTSPRLRRQLEQDLEQRKLHEQERKHDDHRQLRDMPLMEDSDFTTSRTTNFSSNQEADEDETVGLTDREMYNLLLTNSEESSSAMEEADLFEKYVKERGMDEEEQQTQLRMLRRTLEYAQVPILMKDTDGTYVGTWKDRVPELEVMKLKLVPEDRVRYNLADDDSSEQVKTATEIKT